MIRRFRRLTQIKCFYLRYSAKSADNFEPHQNPRTKHPRSIQSCESTCRQQLLRRVDIGEGTAVPPHLLNLCPVHIAHMHLFIKANDL